MVSTFISSIKISGAVMSASKNCKIEVSL